jgi:hypothetical protein
MFVSIPLCFVYVSCIPGRAAGNAEPVIGIRGKEMDPTLSLLSLFEPEREGEGKEERERMREKPEQAGRALARSLQHCGNKVECTKLNFRV